MNIVIVDDNVEYQPKLKEYISLFFQSSLISNDVKKFFKWREVFG
ncbi:MAG: hypothetical protein RRY18_02940 [Clostridia bacterium]